MADGMLGSVARKLRLFGFDVEYRRDDEDEKLIESCLREGRILLTSDRRLWGSASKRGVRALLVSGEDDEDRLFEILSGLGVESVSGDTPRCTVCNGRLVKVEKEEIRGKVPDGVLERNDEFYVCESCGKVYWRGSHWERIDELIDSLNRRLKTNRAS